MGSVLGLALAFGACRGAGGELAPALERAPRHAHEGRARTHPSSLDVRLAARGASILSSFVETDFGVPGVAAIEKNRIVLEPGAPLAGVTFTGASPKPPYALEVEFTKRFGGDFPCALTFPVADAHLSLVLGGWGGTVCGLSSLDGLDASRNETRFLRAFPPGSRAHVRVEVDSGEVRALLDGVEVVRVALTGRRLGVRAELLPSRPIGVASFATAVEVHAVRLESGVTISPCEPGP